MRKIYIISIWLTIFINLFSFSKTLIIPKKVVKIGNEIILESDVKKYIKLYNTSYKDSVKLLTEEALLYMGAKMYTEKPTEESINNKIKKDKAYYASMVSKSVKNVTDEEFLANLHYNNISMKTYKNDVKKGLWIKNFLREMLQQEKVKPYSPSNKEINDLIKNKPKLFEEKAGVLLSMIYFSFYDETGTFITEEEIQKLNKKSQLCLKELINSEKFEDMVIKYSDDLISKNNEPNGNVGIINTDDPKVLASFSEKIIDEFKKAKKGIIKKVFQTMNGFYIFKIDEIIKPKKMTEEASIIKAGGYLQKKHKQDLEKNVRNQLIKELKKKIKIVIY